VLVLLLVASLLPVANLAGGFSTPAHAEDSAQQTTADVAQTGGAASGTPATIEDRQEVIYGLLDGSGAPRSGYVVNRFQVAKTGTLNDQGDYRTVKNLTSSAALTLSGRQVSGLADEGDFYYEGMLDTIQLPWLISITYTLDGREVQPAQLAGSAGKLGIHIKTEKNEAVNPVFFEHYLLQIQLTLDTKRIKSVNAPNATLASAGEDQQVAFMVLPNKEGDLRLEAQVTDFEMPGIQISALPFSMVFDIPDTDSMVADMATLSDAIGELNKGVRQLNDGVQDMEHGAAALTSGSNDLDTGLTLLNKNSPSLTTASSQVGEALRVIAEQLEAGSIDPAQIEQLTDGLRQLAGGLYSGDASQPGLAEGLAQIQGGVTQATTAMDNLIGALSPVTDSAAINALMGELGALTPNSQAMVQNLLNTNIQAATIQGAWYGPDGNNGIKASFESVTAGLGESIENCQYMAGQLNTIASGLESSLGGIAGLQTLTTSMCELSNGYSEFNTGLVAYASGVDTLAKNYTAFNGGLAQLLSGVRGLREGTSGLYDGTSELYAQVYDLPETMQKEVDSFLEDYRVSDFTPVSFVSENSEHLSRVQFVLITDAVKVEIPDEPPSGDEPVKQTFWDRLLALFS
jgi:X-X-X-Leu-X-X-Gly heptad repeat protein